MKGNKIKKEQDTTNVFITTTIEIWGMSALERVPPPPSIACLVGAIELSDIDNMLAIARF